MLRLVLTDFNVFLFLAMKTILIHRLGVFWCLASACIGLKAQVVVDGFQSIPET